MLGVCQLINQIQMSQLDITLFILHNVDYQIV